ncbi:MAG: Penicillin-binding protein, 1A family [Parcubacteria group bacterium GW2011_GWB1_44_7]|nr:MAG: Penicillin-binding protein, 1A family [Parcubacteria group bacterium GW2011_GWB1_44_7]
MKKRQKLKKILKKAAALATGLFLFGGGAIFLWLGNMEIPNLNTISERRITQSTKIFDRAGETLLYDIHENERRTVVPFDEISRNIKNATVAIEDASFYQHRGIEPKAILRAVFANLLNFGYSQGGSTITQQVVKNSILTNDKTITRKLKEWVLALKLEKTMSKEEILALYLNEIPYGGSIYGVEQASQSYFGKKAAALSIAEAAYLASLPQAPSYFSPFGNNRDKLEERKNFTLERMLAEHFISQEEYETAKKETVNWLPPENTGLRAPHFVMFIKDYLENKYGKETVRYGGLKVTTTLDYSLQTKAEEIVKKWALQNKINYNAENAALTAIDPKTGQILAMVGSRDYFDQEIDGNFNVALARRQPGSAFKPIVYATAFAKGYTPETVVFDLPTEFSTYCNPDGTPVVTDNEDKCYMPENYDQIYRGPIDLRHALAQSINIPAIKVLYLAGLKESLRLAKDLGIESLTNVNQYGLTLVLGGGEVSLLDLTGAYATFANSGVRNPYVGILKVEDENGKVLEEFQPRAFLVLSENIALTISNILSDEEARQPAFGVHSFLYIDGREVAVKTGTTNDYRDAWILGYTPSLAVGAWAGNNDNSPMEKKVAGFIIAPMWHEFVMEVLKTYPEEKFKKPEIADNSNLKPVLRGFWQGNQSYFIDKMSGKLATQYTPLETKEEKMVRQVHSILYWLDKDNPLGLAPINPTDDSQFNSWEYAVRKWAEEKNLTDENQSVIPISVDDVHSPDKMPILKIQGLKNSYGQNETVNINIANGGSYPLRKVDLFLNGRYVSSTVQTPFALSVKLSAYGEIGDNKIEVIASDVVYNKAKTEASFRISE